MGCRHLEENTAIFKQYGARMVDEELLERTDQIGGGKGRFIAGLHLRCYQPIRAQTTA